MATVLLSCGTAALIIRGTQRTQHAASTPAAVLVSSNDLADLPFSLICNAHVDQRVVWTATHCLEPIAWVAAGGLNVCAAHDWILYGPFEIDDWKSIGDLARVSIGADHAVELPSNSEDMLFGFGRTGGSGAFSCELQSVSLQPIIDGARCRSNVGGSGLKVHCRSGAALCPGWSGAGLRDVSGAFVGVVTAGTACGSATGVLTVLGPPDG